MELITPESSLTWNGNLRGWFRPVDPTTAHSWVIRRRSNADAMEITHVDWTTIGQQMQTWGTMPGLNILLIGSPTGDLVDLLDLPIPNNDIDPILSRLPVHLHLLEVLSRKELYSSATEWLGNLYFTGLFVLGDNDFYPRFAYSSVYDTADVPFSRGVIFGCREPDVRFLKDYLELLPVDHEHPLVIPYLVVELQRDRLDKVMDQMIDRAAAVDNLLLGLRRAHLNAVPPFLAELMSTIRRDCLILQADLEILTRDAGNLQSFMDAMSVTRDNEPRPIINPAGEYTKRLKRRLQDIGVFYKDASRSCQINLEIVMQGHEMLTKDVADRNEKATRGLTFVAMVFLPMSAMAAIFAMPVFEFKADWKDWRGRPANTSDDKPKDDPSNPTSTTVAAELMRKASNCNTSTTVMTATESLSHVSGASSETQLPPSATTLSLSGISSSSETVSLSGTLSSSETISLSLVLSSSWSSSSSASSPPARVSGASSSPAPPSQSATTLPLVTTSPDKFYAPVVSVYLWPYLAVTLFLTWFTIETWWFFTSSGSDWSKRSATLALLSAIGGGRRRRQLRVP